MILFSDGQPEGASRCGWSCTSVTIEKKAKIASSTQTITDWARATIDGPSRLSTAMPTTTSVVKRLSQYRAGLSPTISEVAYAPNETATIEVTISSTKYRSQDVIPTKRPLPNASTRYAMKPPFEG